MSLLRRENIDILLLSRYVDDIRNFLWPIYEGWRWSEGCFKFDKLWQEEDLLSGLTDEQRTTPELVKAMYSLVEFIQFEEEDTSMFSDYRLPTLDTSIWVCESTGTVLYSFYENPTCLTTVVHKNTALNVSSIRATLVQETVRRIKNCSSRLPMEEKQSILSCFTQKLFNSGHSIQSIQFNLVHGTVKYLEFLRLSELPRVHKSFKPLHCEKSFNVYNRNLHKFLSKTG